MSKKIIGIALIFITCVLTVISFLILPEIVVTQFSLGGGDPTTMPRLYAVVPPVLLGLGGALTAIFGDEGKQGKGVLISVVGIIVFAIMLFANR